MEKIPKNIRLEVYKTLYKLYNKKFKGTIMYYDNTLYNDEGFCDNIHFILNKHCCKSFSKYFSKKGNKLDLLPELAQFRPKNKSDEGHWFEESNFEHAYSKRKRIINKIIELYDNK